VVRTALGAEVETSVSVQGSESVRFIDATQTGTVSSGGSESVVVTAPPGTVLELLGLTVVVQLPSSATAGDHTVDILSDTKQIVVLLMRSDSTARIFYGTGFIQEANLISDPPTVRAQQEAIRGYRVDDTNGLEIVYSNQLDAAQSDDRQYKLWAREIQVAEQ